MRGWKNVRRAGRGTCNPTSFVPFPLGRVPSAGASDFSRLYRLVAMTAVARFTSLLPIGGVFGSVFAAPDGFGATTCLVMHLPATAYDDPQGDPPPPGVAYYDLVRGRNAVGAGT